MTRPAGSVPTVVASIEAANVIDPLSGTAKGWLLSARYLMWSKTLKSAAVLNGSAETENDDPLNARVSSIAISPGPNPLFHFAK